jgi:hypothetical protein
LETITPYKVGEIKFMVDFVDFCPSLRVLEKGGGGGGVLFAGECDGELTGFVEDESTMHIHKR